MPKEIEIKFRIDSEAEILRKLESLGATKTNEGLEHNEVFDNGKLREKGFLLRLRQFDGKNILTFKTAIEKEEFKKADEIELEVNNLQRMKNILQNLGYEVFWIYEKRTKRFLLEGTKVSIDELTIGTFMEIEGSESSIRNVIEKLGLDPMEGITDTYFDLYEKFCKEKGMEMENLVFWKKAR